MQFCQPCEKIFTKRTEISRLICKKMKQLLFLPKRKQITRKKQFQQRRINFFDKRRSVFPHRPNKKVRKRNFSEKSNFQQVYSTDTYNTALTETPNVFSQKAKIFRSRSQPDFKIWDYPRNECFLKLLRRTSRRQFWQSRRNFFAWRPKKFHITSKKEAKD